MNMSESEIKKIFALFSDECPVSAETVNTSRDAADFRNAVFIRTAEGNRYVLKIASNDFTFPDRIRMWKRTVEEYRKLGYYSPLIYTDRDGGFPTVDYDGNRCVAYVEEHSKYGTAADRTACDGEGKSADGSAYLNDIWAMTAKIAAKRLDYTDYPSAYCLFETFCPSDKTDEVLENALEWREYADHLPETFSAQVQRIWKLWNENRDVLKEIYGRLPTSVFQADLNPTNLLVDGNGKFMGICDFNLCGRDVFLNYLMRENYGDFEKETALIRRALKVACRYYVFSKEEKEAALPLYRCLKPLWFIRVQELKKAGDSSDAVRRCLDRIERSLTEETDFRSYME